MPCVQAQPLRCSARRTLSGSAPYLRSRARVCCVRSITDSHM